MQAFFTDDVEFYHDKGGPTLGIADLTTSFHNMCDSRKVTNIRREAVKDSVRVFPLKNSNVIYGAVISGQHYFYTQEKGHPERLDGLAKFTHLWLRKDGIWKMSRILSYDHGPAPYVNKRTAIKLAGQYLRRYAGEYVGPHAKVVIRSDKGSLLMLSGDQRMILFPQSKTSFFAKERDLTFEFVTDSHGKVTKMLVRENGELVEETLPQK